MASCHKSKINPTQFLQSLPGPKGDIGPQGIPGPSFNSSLNVVFSNSTPQTFPANSNFIFTSENPIGSVGTDISYNAVTGEFTISTAGRYLISWSLNVENLNADATNLIATLTLSGIRIATSGFPLVPTNGTVSIGGSIAIFVNVGQILSLINESNSALTLGLTLNALQPLRGFGLPPQENINFVPATINPALLGVGGFLNATGGYINITRIG